MNNVVPTSPLLPQMSHPHSYPNMGQITNPYEQQPPGKELNKYASLKAVGKQEKYCMFFILFRIFHTPVSSNIQLPSKRKTMHFGLLSYSSRMAQILLEFNWECIL